MSESILVAIITGGLAFLGTVITCYTTSQKNAENMKINQAKTEVKIDNLAEEVKKHNNFARRMPVLEEQIKNINQRIDDIEKRSD